MLSSLTLLFCLLDCYIVRRTSFVGLNILMWRFFKDCRDNGIVLNGKMLKEHAMMISRQLEGWLDAFKRRHKIDLKMMSGVPVNYEENDEDMKMDEDGDDGFVPIRTVTLCRQFVCAQQGNCRVNYAMRVICRACRYVKCIRMGMERQAVQPRRDCNIGRRKISYPTSTAKPVQRNVSEVPTCGPPLDRLASAMETSGLSPEVHYAASYSSSISEDHTLSPKRPIWVPPPPTPESVLEDLLREERLDNERRRILYCGPSSISNLLSISQINDIYNSPLQPYGPQDMKELTFSGIQKDIRGQILVIYEWMRGWSHFNLLNTQDKKSFLRRCILYHTILDPAYLTMRLGLPHRFVMFNGMYVGIAEDSEEGWRDEDCISASLKKTLYRPLLDRVVNEIAYPMHSIKLSFHEFLILKALVSFKSASVSDISPPLKEHMIQHIDLIFRALNHHYITLGLDSSEIAERTGNLILLMSSVFAVGMECLESHQKIQFFDLWELDDLLVKLMSRSPR
uniref:Nuclear receptor domain-containing protein n=1 Tax=Heterorhabditis bacteriophora TaxID=37862 RepID=A0A1I7XKJ2_HETBA